MKKIGPYRNEKERIKAEKEKAVKTLAMFPTRALLETIETTIKVLRDREIEIRDFDHKENVVQQVRMVGAKAYFLTEKENGEEYLSELQHAKENNKVLCKIIQELRKENEMLKKKGEADGEGME